MRTASITYPAFIRLSCYYVHLYVSALPLLSAGQYNDNSRNEKNTCSFIWLFRFFLLKVSMRFVEKKKGPHSRYVFYVRLLLAFGTGSLCYCSAEWVCELVSVLTFCLSSVFKLAVQSVIHSLRIRCWRQTAWSVRDFHHDAVPAVRPGSGSEGREESRRRILSSSVRVIGVILLPSGHWQRDGHLAAGLLEAADSVPERRTTEVGRQPLVGLPATARSGSASVPWGVRAGGGTVYVQHGNYVVDCNQCFHISNRILFWNIGTGQIKTTREFLSRWKIEANPLGYWWFTVGLWNSIVILGGC